MFIYYPISLGFVINVSQLILPRVKKQLIYAASFLESDDSGCIYHPEGFVLKKNPGPVVSSISNYSHDDFNFAGAAIEVMHVLNEQDSDTIKFLICVLDKWKMREITDYNYRKISNISNRLKCRVLMCKIDYKNVDELGKTILKIYKDTYAAVKK